MSLRVAVAAAFKQKGRNRIGANEFVVALSLDRDWLSPDQAKRLVDLATSEGLVSQDDGDLVAEFDVDGVDIPEEFVPDESLFREKSTFERVLDALVADGHDKQQSVAAINELQGRLGVRIEAAAVVYARRNGVDVGDAAAAAYDDLTS
ncbi:DUF2240 family protein [Halobacteriaceae archaeon GCM10025711]